MKTALAALLLVLVAGCSMPWSDAPPLRAAVEACSLEGDSNVELSSGDEVLEVTATDLDEQTDKLDCLFGELETPSSVRTSVFNVTVDGPGDQEVGDLKYSWTTDSLYGGSLLISAN